MNTNARSAVAVGILFLALSVAMLYPQSFHLATHVYNPGDPLLNAWILGWVTRTIYRDPLNLYHGNIFYPYPYSLTFSESLVGSFPIAAPVIWLTGNPVLAVNVLVLLSFALSGVGAYLLTHYLTRSQSAGIVAGMIYAFAPYRFGQISHANLLSSQWFPFIILFCFLILRRRNWAAYLGFAITFVLQALSSFYYGLFLVVIVAVFILYAVFMESSKIRLEVIIRFAIICIPIAAVILLFATPYFRSQQIYGFTRGLDEVRDLSASLTDYLVAPASNRLYGSLTAPLTSRSQWPAEHSLFPGIVPVGLAAAGLVIRRGQARSRRWSLPAIGASRPQAFFLLLGGMAMVLSFGPDLHLGGFPTAIPLPYLLLYHFVPGFSGLRAPVRFDILVMLALAVLAGYGIARLIGHCRHRGAGGVRRKLLPIAASIVILVEYLSIPVGIVPVETGSQVPDVYRWLADQPIEIPIMELPADDPVHNFWYMYFSTYHWHPIVNGHSGFIPDDFWVTVTRTLDFPSPAAIDRLRSLGVGLVIVHAERYPAGRAAAIHDRAAQSPDLEYVWGSRGDTAYRILPSPTVDNPTAVSAP